MKTLIAVKSGYYFALVPADYLHNIALEPTGIVVSIPDKHGSWPLYRGKTFEDAQKFDKVLDDNNFAIYEVASYAVNKQTPAAEEKEKCFEVTFARTGVAFIKCKPSELKEKANALKESEITWTDDWDMTDYATDYDEVDGE